MSILFYMYINLIASRNTITSVDNSLSSYIMHHFWPQKKTRDWPEYGQNIPSNTGKLLGDNREMTAYAEKNEDRRSGLIVVNTRWPT